MPKKYTSPARRKIIPESTRRIGKCDEAEFELGLVVLANFTTAVREKLRGT